MNTKINGFKWVRRAVLFAAVIGCLGRQGVESLCSAAAGGLSAWSTALGEDGMRVRVDSGLLQTSKDGVIWASPVLGVKTFVRGVTYGRSRFVAVGGSYFDVPGVTFTSKDGITWTRRNPGNKINLYAVACSPELFVSVGDAGAIFTSQDAARWTRQRSGISVLLSTVAYGNGIFVAGGESGTILVSGNGTAWREVNIGSNFYAGRINYSNGRFEIRSNSGLVTSPDGLNWQRPEFESQIP
jgi:hypothetical protein